MSGENWTPGPWRVQDACVRSHRGVVAPLGQYVYVGADEDQANAHLIAAAPDLSAAIVAAVFARVVHDARLAQGGRRG